MDNNAIVVFLEQIARRCALSVGEAEAIAEAVSIVREKPYTRTLGEVQSIVDAVRAGFDVEMEYYDADRAAMGDYELCALPTF
ncbi:MAG: hypothetical protein RSB86_19075 [Comamonas sp.]|uniref:hypothetical protein n=1 Tax=Comamonas sp. TaxID=34028 RepID=UPI002FCBFE91